MTLDLELVQSVPIVPIDVPNAEVETEIETSASGLDAWRNRPLICCKGRMA